MVTKPSALLFRLHSDYFEQLINSPYLFKAYPLDSQAELDRYKNGSGPSTSVTYDPSFNAARVFLGGTRTGLGGINQIWLPINLTGAFKILITWDAWYSREFNLININHKAYNVRGGTDNIWFEVRQRYDQNFKLEFRGYDQGRSSGTLRPPAFNQSNNAIAPMANQFRIQTETWTRFWIEIETRAPDEFALISTWVADENRPVTPLGVNWEMRTWGGLNRVNHFDLEFDSSSTTRISADLTAYVKKVAILKDYPNVNPFLQT